MKEIKLALCGANGRMGRAIKTLIDSDLRYKDFILVAELVRSSTAEEIKKACKISDVIVNFALPESIKDITQFASMFLTNIVIGTTALEDIHFDHMDKASKNIAIIYAPNASLGANVLEYLSMKAANLLKYYDIEIIDKHHRYKKDAPSGTAISIKKSISNVKEMKIDKNINISSIRAGGIFGEHDVIFAGDNEMVTISHKAMSRKCFAEGALFAARKVINMPAGVFFIKDILDI